MVRVVKNRSWRELGGKANFSAEKANIFRVNLHEGKAWPGPGPIMMTRGGPKVRNWGFPFKPPLNLRLTLSTPDSPVQRSLSGSHPFGGGTRRQKQTCPCQKASGLRNSAALVTSSFASAMGVSPVSMRLDWATGERLRGAPKQCPVSDLHMNACNPVCVCAHVHPDLCAHTCANRITVVIPNS